jgi:hypothetical protein
MEALAHYGTAKGAAIDYFGAEVLEPYFADTPMMPTLAIVNGFVARPADAGSSWIRTKDW